MTTRVYILAALTLAAWVLGGPEPVANASFGPNDPPAAKDDDSNRDGVDADEDGDADPMAGPGNPQRRRMRGDRAGGDDEDRPHWRRRGEGGRPGFRGRDRDRRGADEPIAPEMETEVMTLLEAHVPELHRRMAKLRDEKQERYQSALRKMMPMMREFTTLREEHPEMADVVIQEFKTERSVRSLAKRYIEARRDKDADAQTRLEGEFRELMKQRHALQMQRRRFRLEEFRRRLEQEQARLEEEARNLEAEQSGFESELERRVNSLQEGRRRPRGKFDGPPHRGRRPRDMDGSARRRGPDGPRPPMRDREDDAPPRPDDDDLDI